MPFLKTTVREQSLKLLALDTSTEACSVALHLEGEIKEHFEVAPRQHGKLILSLTESLLEKANLSLSGLDALAFGRGPGSFTGLRIATGVVQGLAFASKLPVVPVSTLAAVALQASRQFTSDYFFAGFDARMDEIYWGLYRRSDNGLVELVGEEQVTDASKVIIANECRGIGVGSAWLSHRQLLEQAIGVERIEGLKENCLPRAGAIADLAVDAYLKGESVPAELAQPVYLRNKVAKTIVEQQAEKITKQV